MDLKTITALISLLLLIGAFNFASAACGGDITVDEDGGNITSPNFPEPYPYNIMCEWHIIAPDHMKIALKFQSFQLESNRDSRNRCVDFVEIRDGGRMNSSVIGPYCGTETPPDVLSAGNELYVQFSSDNSFNYNGFQAVYSRASSTPEPTTSMEPVTSKSSIATSITTPFPPAPNNTEESLNLKPTSTTELSTSFKPSTIPESSTQESITTIKSVSIEPSSSTIPPTTSKPITSTEPSTPKPSTTTSRKPSLNCGIYFLFNFNLSNFSINVPNNTESRIPFSSKGLTGENNSGDAVHKLLTYLTQPTSSIIVNIPGPNNRFVEVGSNVSLTCEAKSLQRRLVKISWSKYGGNLSAGRAVDDGFGHFSINRTEPTDSGVYICSAYDEETYVTKTVRLTVQVDNIIAKIKAN